MAISLGGAVRLPARDRRISLHSFHAGAPRCVAGGEVVRRNAPVFLARAARAGSGPWLRTLCASLACARRLPARLGSRRTVKFQFALAMARAGVGAFGIHLALVDGPVDRLLEPF